MEPPRGGGGAEQLERQLAALQGGLNQRLSALDQHLAGLQGLPHQVGLVSESLAALHQHLVEAGQPSQQSPTDSPAQRPSHVSAAGCFAARGLARPLLEGSRSAHRTHTGTSCSSSGRTGFSGAPRVGRPRPSGGAATAERLAALLADERLLLPPHACADQAGGGDLGPLAAGVMGRRPSDAAATSSPAQLLGSAHVLQRRLSAVSDGSQPASHHPVAPRRPTPPPAAAAPRRRSSTRSNQSGQSGRSSRGTRPSFGIHFDCVAPNAVPSPHKSKEPEAAPVPAAGEREAATESSEGESPVSPARAKADASAEEQEARASWAAGLGGSASGVSLAEISEGGSLRRSTASDFVDLAAPAEDGGLGVLFPGSPLRMAWDGLMALLALLVGILVPVALVYLPADALWRAPCGPLLHASSAAWLLDVLVNFGAGTSERPPEAATLGQRARGYARTWLALDLLTAAPHALAAEGTALGRALCGLKMARLVRLGPLLVGMHKDRQVLGLGGRLSLAVLLLVHGCAVLWRAVLEADGARAAGALEDYAPGQWWEHYIEDAYWVMMTMTTVGYGDIAARGPRSQLFSIVAMLTAPLFFGTIVSLLTHLTRQFFDDEVEAQLEEAARFTRRRGMSLELQKRVEHNLRYQIGVERSLMRPELFARLSPAIQRELSLELLRSTVLRFPLFRDVQHSFIAELAQVHTFVSCLPGDLVVDEGQLMQEVVFVLRGRLLVRCSQDADDSLLDAGDPADAPSRGDLREVDLMAGAWFGEASLFFADRVRTAAAGAVADSELAVLGASAYHKVVCKFPRLLRRHRSIEQALHSGALALKELAYRPPKPQASPRNWCDFLPALAEPGRARRRSTRPSEAEALRLREVLARG